MAVQTQKPKGQFPLLRLAWEYGGRIEHFFAVFIPVSPTFPIFATLPFLFLGLAPRELISIFVAAVPVIAGWPLVRGALYDSVYSPGFHQAALAKDWVLPEERRYYEELLAWREKYGDRGRSPGQLRWGFGCAIVYSLASAGCGPFVFVLYPMFADGAAAMYVVLTILILIACGVTYSRRVQRWFREAQARGFSVGVLRRGFR